MGRCIAIDWNDECTVEESGIIKKAALGGDPGGHGALRTCLRAELPLSTPPGFIISTTLTATAAEQKRRTCRPKSLPVQQLRTPPREVSLRPTSPNQFPNRNEGAHTTLSDNTTHHPTRRHSPSRPTMLNDLLGPLGSLQPRQIAAQILNFALVLSTAFMLWKGLSVATNSPSPIVVVLSGSMEPAFQRGDLLFLWNRAMDTRIGEVVVYNVRGKDIPIVHRVVRRFGGGMMGTQEEELNGKELWRIRVDWLEDHTLTHPRPNPLRLLTKGDNNVADDTELYARGQSFLNREKDVIGSVFGFIPWVGYVTILLSEYPWLKTVMLGLMGLTVVLQRE
ncbi:hypothetical protein IWX50DRAFT_676566 [Phyllosticta citricarpa]